MFFIKTNLSFISEFLPIFCYSSFSKIERQWLYSFKMHKTHLEMNKLWEDSIEKNPGSPLPAPSQGAVPKE